MEVLELDGKRYLKAAVAARDLGYTSDYVGQLCRGGKIDAHLVGRSWYVEESSIRGHKTSRYRSSKEKTRQALKVHLEKKDVFTSVPVRSAELADTHLKNAKSEHFYSKLHQKAVKYDEDASELIPVLTERPPTTVKKLDVRVEGAEALKIKESAKSYMLAATELPKIRFKGALSIEAGDDVAVEATDDSKEESADSQKIDHREVMHLKVGETAGKKKKTPVKQKTATHTISKNKVTLHPTDESPKEQNVPLHRGGIDFEERLSAIEAQASGELRLKKIKRERHSRRKEPTILLVASSAALALLLSIALIAVEETITSLDNGNETGEVNFKLSSVIETVYGLR